MLNNKNKIISKSKTLGDQISLNDLWPQERDIFIRPERLRYIRRLIKEDGCVFCKAALKNPKLDTLCVYQTTYSMVVLNKFPYNNGHVLVIPKKHKANIWDFSKKEYTDLMNLVRLTIEVIYEVYSCAGVNMGLNHGAVAGAGIPEHLHIHVIPRWQGDVNFFPLIADTKVIVESLEDSYKKIKKVFRKKIKEN